jgi:hypothetical protein
VRDRRIDPADSLHIRFHDDESPAPPRFTRRLTSNLLESLNANVNKVREAGERGEVDADKLEEITVRHVVLLRHLHENPAISIPFAY